jgi:hypothetical protein
MTSVSFFSPFFMKGVDAKLMFSNARFECGDIIGKRLRLWKRIQHITTRAYALPAQKSRPAMRNE